MIVLDQTDPDIRASIEICMSNSGKTGRILRLTHYFLGGKIGHKIKEVCQNDCLTTICLMRSGLPFGMGIADELDCPILLLDEKKDVLWNTSHFEYGNGFILENIDFLQDRTIILADAVINDGNTLLSICDSIGPHCKEILIASNVLRSDVESKFSKFSLFVSRISENNFTGKRISEQDGKIGPDTGDRLFNLIL